MPTLLFGGTIGSGPALGNDQSGLFKQRLVAYDKEVDAPNPYRNLPQLQRLLECDAARPLEASHGRAALTAALRSVIASCRERIARGDPLCDASLAGLVGDAGELLANRAKPGLRRVINGTGIILHTNLGRAPLAVEAIAAVADAASSYANLEYELESGKRGTRAAEIEPLLCELTGAEAALVVNNGAAAILLALSAQAAGGEVIVSRGELVEIGGGFRVPDVITQGGARLVEVGATNKVRLTDYAAAITEQTRALLKVHQSNFRVIGFTAEVPIAELAALAHQHGLPLVADLGSGLIAPSPGSSEPTLAQALAAGADIVTCSGDKLLGGPQAGLILGTRTAIEPLRKHPLLRALRLDKMSLAALEATLILHRDQPERVPVLRMMRQSEDELAARAECLQGLLGMGHVVSSEGFAGGGSLPEERIASKALALDPPEGAPAAAARLRMGHPAIVALIRADRLLIDMLAVSNDDLPELATGLRAIMTGD